jgi:hypothetical protein
MVQTDHQRHLQALGQGLEQWYVKISAWLR